MNEAHKIADRLKRLRTEAGLTQVELARRLKCSDTRVTNVERGTRKASLGLIVDWATACGKRVVLRFEPLEGAQGPVAGLVEMLEALVEAPPTGVEAQRALQMHLEAWSALSGHKVGG